MVISPQAGRRADVAKSPSPTAPFSPPPGRRRRWVELVVAGCPVHGHFGCDRDAGVDQADDAEESQQHCPGAFDGVFTPHAGGFKAQVGAYLFEGDLEVSAAGEGFDDLRGRECRVGGVEAVVALRFWIAGAETQRIGTSAARPWPRQRWQNRARSWLANPQSPRRTNRRSGRRPSRRLRRKQTRISRTRLTSRHARRVLLQQPLNECSPTPAAPEAKN
jgi:hypothetical protein